MDNGQTQSADVEKLLREKLALLPPELAERWEEVLEDDVKYPTAHDRYAAISSVLAARLRGAIEAPTGKSFQTPEDAQRTDVLVQQIRHALQTPELFLGSGATAKVHRLDVQSKYCVKVLTSVTLQKEGKLLKHEASFLNKLDGVSVAGVRTPLFYFYFPGVTTQQIGYCMEFIDGPSFADIFSGNNIFDFVKNIDPREFCDRLRAYVREGLHERGIVHRDLAPRNIMIDRHTLLPRVIDFGRSQIIEFASERTEEADKDLKNIDLLESLLREFQKHGQVDISGLA